MYILDELITFELMPILFLNFMPLVKKRKRKRSHQRKVQESVANCRKSVAAAPSLRKQRIQRPQTFTTNMFSAAVVVDKQVA